jgi:hypothetical protein
MHPAQASPSGLVAAFVVRRNAASLGPFTAKAASNLPSGSDSSSTLSQGSPDPRQRPFGPGHQARYPASYPGPPAEGPAIMSWFPAAFRPPAFACRVILFPPGNWAFLTVGLPGTLRPDPDGVSTFRTSEIRPGWVPPRPRGRRCSPGQMPCPASACRFPAASPFHPAPASHRGATLHEASTEVHAIHPSGLPLACNPRMGRGPLGVSLCSAPRRYRRRTTGRGRA